MKYFSSLREAFNNYIDRRGWVGGQVNVYAHKIKHHCLFTSFVYKGCGWVVRNVQKSTRWLLSALQLKCLRICQVSKYYIWGNILSCMLKSSKVQALKQHFTILFQFQILKGSRILVLYFEFVYRISLKNDNQFWIGFPLFKKSNTFEVCNFVSLHFLINILEQKVYLKGGAPL